MLFFRVPDWNNWSFSCFTVMKNAPNYSFLAFIRDTMYSYITKGKGPIPLWGRNCWFKAGISLLKPDELTFYQANSGSNWLGITGGRALTFVLSQISDQSYLTQSNNCHTQTTNLLKILSRFAQITNQMVALIMGQLHELMFSSERLL